MRAFSDLNEDYYVLKKDIGSLKAGAIFWHNKNNASCGNRVHGSLTLCWTPYGDCYSMWGGDTVRFNASFLEDDGLFELAKSPFEGFKPGTYEFVIGKDGKINIKSYSPSTRYDDCEEDDGK